MNWKKNSTIYAERTIYETNWTAALRDKMDTPEMQLRRNASKTTEADFGRCGDANASVLVTQFLV